MLSFLFSDEKIMWVSHFCKNSPLFQKKIVFLENIAFSLFFLSPYVPSSNTNSIINISHPDVRSYWDNLEIFVLNLEMIHLHIEWYLSLATDGDSCLPWCWFRLASEWSVFYHLRYYWTAVMTQLESVQLWIQQRAPSATSLGVPHVVWDDSGLTDTKFVPCILSEGMRESCFLVSPCQSCLVFRSCHRCSPYIIPLFLSILIIFEEFPF